MSNLVDPLQKRPVHAGIEVPLLPAAQVELMFGTLDLTRSRLSDADCEVAMVRFGGAAMVTETVASGRLPNEIALQLGLPVMWFDTWCETHIDGAEMARALKLGAESYVLKAQMVLTVDPTSTHEAAQARALAAEYVRLAEKLDHQKWGSRRADGLAGQTVNIQMNLGAGNNVTSAVDASAVDPRNRVEPAQSTLPESMTFQIASSGVHIDLSCDVPDGEHQY